MGKEQVSKLLVKHGVEYESLKRPMKTFVAVLRFSSLAQRDAAQEKLKGIVCPRGRALRSKVAEVQDWGNRQRQHQERQQQGGQGQGGGGGERAQEPRPRKTLDETVSPLLGLPYPEQLARKEGEMRDGCVKRMFRDLRTAYHDKRKRMAKARDKGETAVG